MEAGGAAGGLTSLIQSGDYFMFAGSTNYIMDQSLDFGDIKVDWSESDKTFGFVQVFTEKESCLSEKQKLAIGSTEEFPNVDVTENDPEQAIDERSIKLPST